MVRRSKKTTPKKKSEDKTLLTTKHWQTTNVARLIKREKVKTTDLEIGDVVVDFENDNMYQVAEITQKGSSYDVRDTHGNGAIAVATTEFIILDRKCLVKGYNEPMFEDE